MAATSSDKAWAFVTIDKERTPVMESSHKFTHDDREFELSKSPPALFCDDRSGITINGEDMAGVVLLSPNKNLVKINRFHPKKPLIFMIEVLSRCPPSAIKKKRKIEEEEEEEDDSEKVCKLEQEVQRYKSDLDATTKTLEKKESALRHVKKKLAEEEDRVETLNREAKDDRMNFITLRSELEKAKRSELSMKSKLEEEERHRKLTAKEYCVLTTINRDSKNKIEQLTASLDDANLLIAKQLSEETITKKKKGERDEKDTQNMDNTALLKLQNELMDKMSSATTLLTKVNQQLKTNTDCTVCYSAKKDTAFSCGHMYCSACSRKIKKCALCNKVPAAKVFCFS